MAEGNYKQKTPKSAPNPFKIDTKKLDQALDPLFKKIAEERERATNNWFVMLTKQVSEVIGTAVWILLSPQSPLKPCSTMSLRHWRHVVQLFNTA